ncbi:MAG TPA: thiopurine S-methyltransferase [Stenomitos sp.]
MEAKFWLQRWEDNKIGFHRSDVNPVLQNYFARLSLLKGSRIFLPLCGKTLDIAWLLSEGYRIVGVELSEIAIQQLFDELGVEPQVSRLEHFSLYLAKDIDIFVGDIFDLSNKILAPVDAIYDRAALVALPEAMRRRYTAQLVAITGKVPQLLVTYEYDQNLMDGPPFSVSSAEVKQHYSNSYALTSIASSEVPGGFKGMCAAQEHVWLLQAH